MARPSRAIQVSFVITELNLTIPDGQAVRAEPGRWRYFLQRPSFAGWPKLIWLPTNKLDTNHLSSEISQQDIDVLFASRTKRHGVDDRHPAPERAY